MSNLSRAELENLAKLARINLTDEELTIFGSQLGLILDSVAKVQEVVNDSIVPMSHALPMTNVFRPDVVSQSLSNSEALAAAPSAQDHRFKVPRILDEE